MWFDKGVNNPECDVHDLHHLGLSTSQEGDIFVEVGTFLGEGLHCLIDKVAASDKKIKVFCVDTFDLEWMNKENEQDFDLPSLPTGALSLERERDVKIGIQGNARDVFQPSERSQEGEIPDRMSRWAKLESGSHFRRPFNSLVLHRCGPFLRRRQIGP